MGQQHQRWHKSQLVLLKLIKSSRYKNNNVHLYRWLSNILAAFYLRRLYESHAQLLNAEIGGGEDKCIDAYKFFITPFWKVWLKLLKTTLAFKSFYDVPMFKLNSFKEKRISARVTLSVLRCCRSLAARFTTCRVLNSLGKGVFIPVMYPEMERFRWCLEYYI